MAFDRYRIRTMTSQEVAMTIEWAAAEGWNPGLHDAACFRAADPHGFLVGLLDDVPIATISVVKYGPSFGFLGLYIVQPRYRGQGYGLRVWNAGLAHLGERTIGLDGVVAQQANYRRSGFALAYRNVRYQGIVKATSGRDPRTVPLASVPFDVVNAYDRRLFPADRSAFLRCWLDQRESIAIGRMEQGALAGYGVIRPARSGFRIGPLFADDAEIAAALFDDLVSRVPGDTVVHLDVPEDNAAAVALADEHRMTIAFETARMYSGPTPAVPIERLFGVTTFELG